MKIELMSPAGNITSFIHAVNNGADAVYLGLNKFNARRPARNFTVYELKKTINYAHSIGRKIYLALNIDLKDNELEDAAAIISLCSEIKIDAVIIKDPSLFYILKKFFKGKISIHFSTQNAITSSYGVRFASGEGASRVILARELSFDEIKKCTELNKAEIEIFTEGSMCFSVSGRCLMSSWVGSRSGNRGVCTAPCRVLWESSGEKENFFSMKDMSLVRSIDKLMELNIAAMKIEGRLKNPLWVGKITGLYRKAIDDPGNKNLIEDLFEELKKFSAREIESGHFFFHENLISRNEDWEKYEKIEAEENFPEELKDENKILITANDVGLNIEIILFKRSEKISIAFGNRPKKARESSIDYIKTFFKENKVSGKTFDFIINTEEYTASSSFLQKAVKEIENRINSMIKSEESVKLCGSELLSFIKCENKNFKREKLLGDVPDRIIIKSEQMNYFVNNKFDISNLVVELSADADKEKLKKISEKYNIILSIPEILFEKDAARIEEKIISLFNEGFNEFEANSYCGMEMLKNINCSKTLGPGLTVMNHIAAEYYFTLGYASVYVSIESDSSMLKALSSFTNGEVNAIVFSRIPLFISRVETGHFKNGKTFKDKYVELECEKYNNLNYFLSKKPLSFIGSDVKALNIYFNSLSVDLRFYKNPEQVFRNIIDNKIKEFSTFNLFEKLV